MKAHFFLILALLCVLSPLSAQTGSVLKVYFVSPADPAMTVENMTQERFWEKVPASSDFILNVPGIVKNSPRTVFKAVSSSSTLFIRIDADEENVEKLPFGSRVPGRDAGEIFKVANVEFFFDPGVLRKDAAQVVFSVTGGIYDGITNGNPGWVYEGVATKTLKNKASWSMFGAFPWKDHGVDNVFSMTPASHALIGFNACRGHSTFCYPRAFGTQWSKTPPNRYPRSDCFVVLALPVKGVVELLQQLVAQSPAALALEGALPSGSEKIYFSVLEKVLSATKKNASSLPDKQKKEILDKLAELEKVLRKDAGKDELVRALDECGKLGKTIHAAQMNMSDDLLNDF